MHLRKSVLIVATVFISFITLAAVISIASTGGGGGEKKTSEVANATAATDERRDLDYLKIDDRSNQWITDIWLEWEITNHSSETSDYTFEWEAIDTTTNKRVDDGYQFENGVKPGQTLTGETFTQLKKADNIKINITDFERTRSW